MVKLSPGTLKRVEILFDPAIAVEVVACLERECGSNLPMCDGLDSEGLERVRFAALKVSRGDSELLHTAIQLAQLDWRDLLMEAGFGHDTDAHSHWMPAPR